MERKKIHVWTLLFWFPPFLFYGHMLTAFFLYCSHGMSFGAGGWHSWCCCSGCCCSCCCCCCRFMPSSEKENQRTEKINLPYKGAFSAAAPLLSFIFPDFLSSGNTVNWWKTAEVSAIRLRLHAQKRTVIWRKLLEEGKKRHDEKTEFQTGQSVSQV